MTSLLNALGLCLLVAAPLACGDSDHPDFEKNPAGTYPDGRGFDNSAGGTGGTGSERHRFLVADDVRIEGGFRPSFDVSGDGQHVFFISDADVVEGQNPTSAEQLFMVEVSTKDITQLTDRGAGDGSFMEPTLLANYDGSLVRVTGAGLKEIRPFDPEPKLQLIPGADQVVDFVASDDFSFTAVTILDRGVLKLRILDEETKELIEPTGAFSALTLGLAVSGDGEWIAFSSSQGVGVDSPGLFRMTTEGAGLEKLMGEDRGGQVRLSQTAVYALSRDYAEGANEPWFLVDTASKEPTEVVGYSILDEYEFGGDDYIAWIGRAEGELSRNVEIYEIEDGLLISPIASTLDFVSGIATSSDGSVLISLSQEHGDGRGTLEAHFF